MDMENFLVVAGTVVLGAILFLVFVIILSADPAVDAEGWQLCNDYKIVVQNQEMLVYCFERGGS